MGVATGPEGFDPARRCGARRPIRRVRSQGPRCRHLRPGRRNASVHRRRPIANGGAPCRGGNRRRRRHHGAGADGGVAGLARPACCRDDTAGSRAATRAASASVERTITRIARSASRPTGHDSRGRWDPRRCGVRVRRGALPWPVLRARERRRSIGDRILSRRLVRGVRDHHLRGSGTGTPVRRRPGATPIACAVRAMGVTAARPDGGRVCPSRPHWWHPAGRHPGRARRLPGAVLSLDRNRRPARRADAADTRATAPPTTRRQEPVSGDDDRPAEIPCRTGCHGCGAPGNRAGGRLVHTRPPADRQHSSPAAREGLDVSRQRSVLHQPRRHRTSGTVRRNRHARGPGTGSQWHTSDRPARDRPDYVQPRRALARRCLWLHPRAVARRSRAG